MPRTTSPEKGQRKSQKRAPHQFKEVHGDTIVISWRLCARGPPPWVDEVLQPKHALQAHGALLEADALLLQGLVEGLCVRVCVCVCACVCVCERVCVRLISDNR